jgi:polysaccharide biosynthesis protein PslG
MHSHRKRSPRWAGVSLFLVIMTLFSLTPGIASLGNGARAAEQTRAAPSTGLEYGMVMALLENNDDVRSMGYNWVQYGAYWKDAEPSPNQFSWGHVDNILRYARQANIGLLIRISRPPQWARDPACANVDTCPPLNPNDFGRFANRLAAHVRNSPNRPPRVAYEIWNEPNTDIEWGNLCPDPARYAGLLQAVYNPIKSADPSALVVGGAVTTVGERLMPGCHLDDITFLEGMYQAGAAPYFDILSDHPYGFGSPPEADPSGGGSRLNFRRAETHRALMVQYGDSAKQIWATEMGWALDPNLIGLGGCPREWYMQYSPEQQADYLVRAHRWARSYWPWMGAMFVFNFDFAQAPWYDTCHPFRMWSVKDRPAQSALASFAQNPPPTYTPVPVDGPPVIAAVRYSATQFSRYGGSLTVEVDAHDESATPVDSVEARVTFPDGGTQLFVFSLVSGSNRRGTWRSPPIPIAQNNTGGNQQYTVNPFAVESFPTRRVTNAPAQAIVVVPTRFVDVPFDHWAYSFIEALAELGSIGGYADGTFRPNNSTTRAQLTKIVVLSFNLPQVSPPSAHFTDVPPGSTFYTFVETAYAEGLLGGYPCGGPGEPCDPQNRPYFRPGNDVTRGQIAKIVVSAAGWQQQQPPTPTFADVPPASPFYAYIETAFRHGIVGGYPCGAPGEPCDPQNRPYFRPGPSATRAQISKVVYLAVQAPSPTPTVTTTPTPTRTSTLTVTATTTATATPFATITVPTTPSATTTITARP